MPEALQRDEETSSDAHLLAAAEDLLAGFCITSYV
jgi:hypothetical protein